MLQEIHTDAFWDANDILLFEQVRKELRELIRFLDEGGGAQRQIVTKLTDPIIDSQEASSWKLPMTLKTTVPRSIAM